MYGDLVLLFVSVRSMSISARMYIYIIYIYIYMILIHNNLLTPQHEHLDLQKK